MHMISVPLKPYSGYQMIIFHAKLKLNLKIKRLRIELN